MQQGCSTQLAQESGETGFARSGEVDERLFLIGEVHEADSEQIVFIGSGVSDKGLMNVLSNQVWSTQAVAKIETGRVLKQLFHVQVRESFERRVPERTDDLDESLVLQSGHEVLSKGQSLGYRVREAPDQEQVLRHTPDTTKGGIQEQVLDPPTPNRLWTHVQEETGQTHSCGRVMMTENGEAHDS